MLANQRRALHNLQSMTESGNFLTRVAAYFPRASITRAIKYQKLFWKKIIFMICSFITVQNRKNDFQNINFIRKKVLF